MCIYMCVSYIIRNYFTIYGQIPICVCLLLRSAPKPGATFRALGHRKVRLAPVEGLEELKVPGHQVS